MRILIKLVYDIAFVFSWLISQLGKAVTYFFCLIGLRLQEINFKASKFRKKRQQENEFNKFNDRHDKIHLKELADILNSESKKYQKSIGDEIFYKLKRIISKNLKKVNLKDLTILYNILFDTSDNTKLVEKLKKFIDKH